MSDSIEETPQHRFGTKFLWKLEPGEKWTYFDGFIVVTGPNTKPFTVDREGVMRPIDNVERGQDICFVFV